ncbi:MAG: hypothetical protein IJZ25_04465 [Lachnospiraceae bacterium]|nr:hypothetical protein [Lachnospiraceae bacterium]
MSYIGLNEALKNWKRMLMVGIQLGAVLFLSIVAVTTYQEQSAKYIGFKGFLSGEGDLLAIDTMDIMEHYDTGIEVWIRNVLDDVEAVDYPLHNSISVTAGDSLYYSVYGYSEVIGKYAPPLESGVWFTDAKKEEGYINATITKNNDGIETGDVIDIKLETGKNVKIKICGVIENKATFFSPGITSEKCDIFSMYESYDIYDEAFQREIIFMDKDEMAQTIGGVCLFTFFVKYNDDISHETLERNRKNYQKLYAQSQSFEDLKRNSEAVIANKLMVLVPITACAFVLIGLSIASTSALGTLESMKDYAIFYICGSPWKKMLGLRFVEMMGSCAIGIFIVSILRSVTVMAGYKNIILFKLSAAAILIVAIELVVMVVFSLILPLVIMKKNTPVSVFKNNIGG